MKPRTILFLGANSDIAKAAIDLFAKEGYDLQLALRNPDRFQRKKSDLEIRHSVNVSLHSFDLIKPNLHKDLIQSLDPFPDVVVVAAGYLGSQQIAELSEEESAKILQTNFNGVISVLSHVANIMEERGYGTIVGISSVAGERGRASNYYYGASKAGLTAFLSGLRNRLYKKGIHVITIIPGFVQTKMTEGLKLPPLITAQPGQVAKAIFRAVKKENSGVVYSLKVWKYFMLLIRLIPESLFKKLSL